MPYTLKPNEKTAEREQNKLPLTKKKIFFSKPKSKLLGFLNGKNGSREFDKNKNKTSYVVGCVGNSTTLNYIEYKKRIYSYPLILESLLRTKYKKKNIC